MRIPPAATRSAQDHARLEAAFRDRGAVHVPRTGLMDDGAPRYVNRLIEEASPYLLQHAHNPVDWWPWGAAALAEAARRDVPVFLSAGYATCHWCHVMEHESFDNESVAAVLNADFVPVKLDREERPEIDHIYIMATSLQQGQAGWPNSVWLLPDGRPFHTGTYFPRPQFLQMLNAVGKHWTGGGRGDCEKVGDQLSAAIREIGGRSSAPAALQGAPDRAIAQLAQAYNAAEGGFSGGQQFPHEGYVLFLLDHWRRTGSGEALGMATRTLDRMVAGGLHDQVGGGFHRYTVDVNWRTPHFEKMLYNQALMLRCLTEAWEVTGRATYARAAARCVDYVLRDMAAEDGAFFTAEDADSLDADGHLEEGAFYVWTPQQARAALGEDADLAIAALGLDQPATLEAGPVAHLDPDEEVDLAALDPLLDRLRQARDTRARPLRDEKVLAGWNGLMIRALAEAAHRFGRDDWAEAARRALQAVLHRLDGPEGLARVRADGRPAVAGTLADYAWLAHAALAVGDLGDAERWHGIAERLTAGMLDRFAVDDGRLALVRDGAPLGPVLEIEDGAVPSGESSALAVLVALDARRPDPARRARAFELATALSGRLAEMPVVRLEALLAARVLEAGEGGFRRVVADGKLALDLARQGDGWVLRLDIAEGWHLSTGGDGQLAPVLEGAAADWPSATDAGWTGHVALPLTQTENTLSVKMQVCSGQICLAPVTEVFRIS